MSKRTPRSKKGDGNVPNFVFNIPGTPTFNFSANTPGSAAISTNNFNASTPASPATTNFNFGQVNSPASTNQPSASQPSATSFTFNSPAATTFGLKRGMSDVIDEPNKKDSSGLRRATSDINSTTAKQSAFTFNAPGGAFKFTPSTSLPASAATTGSKSQSSFAPANTNTSQTSSNTSAAAFAFKPLTTPATASTTTSTTTSATPAFSFGLPAASTAATKATSFSTPATAATTSTQPPTFSFGSAASASKPSSSTVTSEPETSKAEPKSTFGGKATEPKSTEKSVASTTVSFASKTTDDVQTSKPSFSFGSTSAPSFTFGAASSTASTTSGAKTTATPKSTIGTEKKEGTVTSSPFTFSAPTTPANSTSVAAAVPHAFSFVKVLEDLEKAATQPPSQIYATLIPFQVNPTVHHTNFRIDNILPSTRFTELPEQAQRELDELEQYIRLENQRCEYIASHKTDQYHDSMIQTKKKIEFITQQLDAIGNMLSGQKESMEAIYDTVKEQLRHANDGSMVLEACKHPGNTPRWLFGYTKEDDYFLQLSKQLNGRLEEYKKCIWEIERTTEAWTQNKVQSPQDIANIMRAQNVSFLALSNKVAALHENITAEKNNYTQYLRMYT